MKVLVACEFTGLVRDHFCRMGHDAWSCDIESSTSKYTNKKGKHILGDVIPLLSDYWDLIIAFPPCTHLTNTANKYYNVRKYGRSAELKHKEREKAVQFFMQIVNANSPRIAIENPVGVMSSRYRKPDQIIQPHYFGDPFEKKTCIWLKNLPKLTFTDHVPPPPRKRFASGRTMPAWYADAWKLPKEERAKRRNKTFPGIAKAMADQWGILPPFVHTQLSLGFW